MLLNIYGLPIDGPIVTGRTFPNSKVQEVSQEELDKALQLGPDVNGINIKFTWLEDNFIPSKNKKKITEDEEIYNTRFTTSPMMNHSGFYNEIFRNHIVLKGNIWHRFWIICPLPWFFLHPFNFHALVQTQHQCIEHHHDLPLLPLALQHHDHIL